VDFGTNAVYKGLTVLWTWRGPRLYAANFRAGTVDVFDGHFQPVGSFTDTQAVAAGLSPVHLTDLSRAPIVALSEADAARASRTRRGTTMWRAPETAGWMCLIRTARWQSA